MTGDMTGHLHALVGEAVLVLVRVVDETPEPEDVKAGWGALFLFLLLIGAVVFLGFSLTKHLRRAQAAEDAGAYGSDEQAAPAAEGETPAEKHETS